MEQIYDLEVLSKEIESHDGMTVGFTLEEHEVNEWKEKGHFSFIRRELVNLPHAKFACTQDIDGDCSYYFLLNTRELAERVLTLFIKMYGYNEHVPLVKCKHSTSTGRPRYDNGSIKACPLFG